MLHRLVIAAFAVAAFLSIVAPAPTTACPLAPCGIVNGHVVCPPCH
jgi:hypothetical protein